MWCVIDAASGAWVSGPHDAEPAAVAGRAVVRAPGSFALGATRWDAGARAFVDTAPTLPVAEWMRLWTADERRAAYASTDPAVIDFRTLALASPVIRLDHPDVVAGVDHCVAVGLLTAARAAAIKAGVRP